MQLVRSPVVGAQVLGGLAALVWLSVAAALPSAAGTFEVKTPEASKGETEIGLNTAFFGGYPVNADPLRRSLEIGAAHAPTDWWKLGAKINLDQEVGADLRAVTAGVETLVVLRPLGGGFGLGLYGSLDKALRDDQTNSVTFGPVLQFGTETTSLALNPFLVRTFGQNRTEGVDLAYGWQVKHALREGFAIGIEGYGVVPNIADSPGLAFQEHRIGPVVYFERALSGVRAGPAKLGARDGAKDVGGPAKDDADDSGPKFVGEIGVYRGLTDGTQDWAVKFKGGFTF